MKLLYTLCLFLLIQSLHAQSNFVKLTKNTIPKSIQYTGKLINAVRFSDSEGEHIVVTTETGETKTKGADDDNTRDAALYAYYYKINGDKSTLTWQVYDFVKECDVDIKANFIPNTFAVTDLDNNGKAEIWLMYKTICHGDVSPSDMKIIMYEAGQKYAVRGTNRVKVSETEYEGGKYTFDVAFKNAPIVFRQYAINLWKKNLMETWK